MSATSSTRPRLLIAALVLAAVVVAIAGLSFSRKIQTFQPLGFQGVDRGVFLEVTAIESEGSGLELSDQILLVNGREYGELIDPASSRRRH